MQISIEISWISEPVQTFTVQVIPAGVTLATGVGASTIAPLFKA